MKIFRALKGKCLLTILCFFLWGNTYAASSSPPLPINESVSSGAPLALVYWGPGACLTCWSSAVQVAKQAGFRVKMVGALFRDFALLKSAKLWIQPGGKSQKAAKAMGPEYLKEIRNFVSNGGAYVGFCAGAFLSTAKIGDSSTDGLGIIPGTSKLWDQSDGPAQVTPVSWNGQVRYLYYHGGPYFDLTGINDPNAHVFAYYHDGKINGVQTQFGKGRVAVTGAHPEASAAWKWFKGQKDPDGSDRDLVVQLMNWATAPH